MAIYEATIASANLKGADAPMKSVNSETSGSARPSPGPLPGREWETGATLTFPERLRELAQSLPNAIAITWLRDGEADAVDISFDELDRRASRIAGELRGRMAVGERVLIMGDAEPLFIAGFLGCLYAGMIAIPAATPRGNQSLGTLGSIVADCRPAAILVAGLSPRTRGRLQSSEAMSSVIWIDIDHLSGAVPEEHFPPPDPQAVAYLQYTSGSTGLPRGVVVTHENLIRNQQMMAEVAGHDSSTCYVSWLPLFHDMGLAGIVLQSLYAGGRSVLIPPRFFVQKPMRWLSAISAYGATTGGAPDFAYRLCARTLDPSSLASLDLRKWRVAISAGEPVRAETLEWFVEKFGPYGFRPEAWLPCYGLAEATCLVTGPTHGRMPRIVEKEPGGRLVSCGFPRQGQRVAIVDPDSCLPRPDGEIGEVWVHGPSVGRGYWGHTEETAESFGARMADDSPAWLRTGDLGFVSAGDLFITGRLKDLIIIRGSNHHPHAIERTVQQCNPAFTEARGAAFPIENDSTERLVIVQEIPRAARHHLDTASAIADIREAVSAEHGVQPQAIYLVRPACIPVTSSGKIQRRECRRRLEEGELAGQIVAQEADR
jgi:acyl-CoA synthetase (AMP-forming)/AMP-acid ligase II